MENKPLLTTALEYTQQGFKVFPLSPLSKIPLKNTTGFKEASTDEATIFNWFAEIEPLANIGFSLLDTPYFCLDIDDHDGKQSGMKSLVELSDGRPLPDVVTAVRTINNGTHLYFKATNIEIKQQIGFKTGIDIIKNFVVAPKSRVRRKDGTVGTYEVVNGKLDSIKEAPAWLLEAITNKQQPKKANSSYTLEAGNIGNPKMYYTAKFMTELMNGVAKGSRNSWITQQYGRMLSLGMSYTVSYEWIRLVNDNFINDPISEGELNKIVLSITKREQRKQFQTERSDGNK